MLEYRQDALPVFLLGKAGSLEGLTDVEHLLQRMSNYN